MIENLPAYISIVFILTTLITIVGFYKATNNSKLVLVIILGWLTIQGLIGLSKFYIVRNTLPPRFFLLVGPAFILIVLLFLTSKRRRWMDGLNTKILTYLHTVRVPVEFVLFWLFIN